MGFSRTNLFKRLESGGPAFIQSLERHVLRNYIYLHAIENGLDIPIGTQDAELLDTRTNDEDDAAVLPDVEDDNDASTEDSIIIDTAQSATSLEAYSEASYKQRAAEIYKRYTTQFHKRFKWIRPTLFNAQLKKDLVQDAHRLIQVLKQCRTWDVAKDAKLAALIDLLTRQHPDEKILIFTQFADTVRYLTEQLKAYGIPLVEGVTGESEDPTSVAWHFSPVSNNKRDLIPIGDEIRVLIATDILSEGQNLQDAAIVVNYDLPWAIIRLIQRAGRVDRIGQQAETIYCYSFLPAEGVERLIRLRERVRARLKENAEVVGADEAFFEDDMDNQTIIDLYNERAGILDGDADTEIDLASQAYQIWKNATDADPRLKTIIEKLPDVVFSTRAHYGTALSPEGVLVYMRTSDGNDSLAWINRQGESATQSQLAILRAAACTSQEPPIDRPPEQHELVKKGVEHIIAEEARGLSGQLGSRTGARWRTYERLKFYAQNNPLFATDELHKAIHEIYSYPLQESAKDTLNRQIRSGIPDEDLVNLVLMLRDADRLCHIQEEKEPQEPQIICSLGLFPPAEP
jgi:Helicase conserved C-terminal domain